MDRQPPQDLDAEKACLGSMLTNAESIDAVHAVIRPDEPECFYTPAHATVFLALTAMRRDGRPVDLIPLADELRKAGKLDAVGGAEYLIQLAESFGDAANAEHYAKVVKEKAQLRRLIAVANRISAAAYDPLAENPEAMAQDFAKQLDDVSASAALDGIETVGSVLRRLPAWWDREHGTIIQTGLMPLDEKLGGGLERGTYTVCGARPSIGKSSLALIVARNVSLQGIAVAYFLLESTATRTVARLVANAARKSVTEIRRRFSHDDRMAAIRSAEQRSGVERIWITDRCRSIASIVAAAKSLIRRREVGLVVVDYIQLVTPAGKQQNREREISSISAELRDLSIRAGVAVLALAQLNREGEERPGIKHLRESGSLENDADIVLLLHRDRSIDRFEGPIEVNIAKNRDGPIGVAEMTLRPSILEFASPTGGDEYYPVPHTDSDDDVPF